MGKASERRFLPFRGLADPVFRPQAVQTRRMTPDERTVRQGARANARNPKGAETGLPPREQPPHKINRIGRKAIPERGDGQGARGAAGGKTGVPHPGRERANRRGIFENKAGGIGCAPDL